MIDTERFHELLLDAMGHLSQKDFAEKSGMSKFTLNKYLSKGIQAPPRISTLQGIADASEGRVSLSDLMHAVGIHQMSAFAKDGLPEDLQIPEEVRNHAKELMEQIKSYIAQNSAKDASISSLLDLISMLYLSDSETIQAGEEMEILPDPRKPLRGAEWCVPVEISWTVTTEEPADMVRYHMIFLLFYCKTTGTEHSKAGVIFLDSAFDLATLSEFRCPFVCKMIQIVSKADQAKFTDFPMCVWRDID